MDKKAKSRLKKFTEQIRKDYTSILDREPINIYKDVIKTGSPSVNFCFGNGHGLPYGYSAVLWGPPKAGKTLLLNSMIGWLHQTDPNAVVFKINTEFREDIQGREEQLRMWGIDPDRYLCIETSHPKDIFDIIEKEIPALIEDGISVRLLAIDSILGIQGKQAQESSDKQPLGDVAKTIQEGLKRILPIQRKHKIAVVLTAQTRDDIALSPYVSTYGTVKFGTQMLKMQGSWALKHYCEYFCCVMQDNTKEGKMDLLGNELFHDSLKDGGGNRERTGHRIKFLMTDSSCSAKGRAGSFLVDYRKGIINIHEEIFVLGVNQGIIDHPNQSIYQYKEKKWKGKAETLHALANDPLLQTEILEELQQRDQKGEFRQKESHLTDSLHSFLEEDMDVESP